MTYADYTYYTDVYMGSVAADDFPRLAIRASAFIDYYTQGRAAGAADLEAVKTCCCALVDKYAVIDAAETTAIERLAKSRTTGAAVKSESVGGYSRTLATGEEEASAAVEVGQMAEKLLAQTCTAYLAHTGLLYRGGGGRCTRRTL